MAAGDLTERHVSRLIDVTSGIDDAELMAKIEERVLPHAATKTPDELARIARDALKRLDPGGTQRRAKAARDQADVAFYPDPDGDGMGDVVIHAPIEDATIVKTAVDAYAATAKAAGDPRGRGQVMADTLTQRLTGQAQATGTPVEIELIMTDQTLLTGSPEPAQLTGHGTSTILPAEIARHLVRAADQAWVRRLFTHPKSGALVALDSHRRVFTGQLRHQLVLTNPICATPWCDAPVRHADHPTPVRNGGTTSWHNAAGLCEACNYTKDLPGWNATMITKADGTRILDLTDPTTHHHHSRAPDPPGPITRRIQAILDAA